MAAPRIHYRSQRRCTRVFEAPALSSADHPWTGFGFEAGRSPGVAMPAHSWSRTTLMLVTDARATLRWKHRGVWSVDRLEAGTVSMMRRDAEIQAALPSGPVSMMVLQLDSGRLHDLAPAQVLAVDRLLAPAQVTRDARLCSLLSDMGAEVAGGCASGRLYAESISLALLGYLAGRYATPRPADGGESRLSPDQMRTLVLCIRERLADDVSVAELAALVQMRPSRFARAFKASFGITPYRFVMRERVAEARELLAGTGLSASQVAAEIGFASQSHFVKVFRQFMGTTPKQYKIGL